MEFPKDEVMHHDLAAAQRHSPHGRMAGGGELQEPQRIH